MNISGIRPIGGYASVGSLSSVSRPHPSSESSASSGDSLSARSNTKEDLQKIAEKRARQTYTVNDFDAQYKPQTPSFGNNKIRTAEVEKAVSDMRRDEAIQQYQYFVGAPENNPSQTAAEGGQTQRAIRGAENFDF